MAEQNYTNYTLHFLLSLLGACNGLGLGFGLGFGSWGRRRTWERAFGHLGVFGRVSRTGLFHSETRNQRLKSFVSFLSALSVVFHCRLLLNAWATSGAWPMVLSHTGYKRQRRKTNGITSDTPIITIITNIIGVAARSASTTATRTATNTKDHRHRQEKAQQQRRLLAGAAAALA